MREAIESYNGMEIYHPGGDRDIRYWDTSNVTNMSGMFNRAKLFNADISKWDTSNVETMSCMFFDATSFSQYIGGG